MLNGKNPNEHLLLYPLASGVDLFFVISGFVMVYSSRDLFGTTGATYAFLSGRITRIVPLYWLTSAIAIPAFSQPVSSDAILKSMFFIPYAGPTGGIVPILGVGWTLNFEMLFYVLFAVCIIAPRILAVGLVCTFLGALVITGHFCMPQAAALLFWTDPIALEFAYGAIIALLYQRVNLPPYLRLALIVGGAGTVWFFAPPGMPTANRYMEWGLPAAALLAGVALGQQPGNPSYAMRAANRLGNASYAIYLIHPLMTAAIILSWRYIHILGRPTVLVVAFGITLALSVLLYERLERPVTSFLRRLLHPSGGYVTFTQ
jgi:peptidoglycan/LPS O-acetylase OafA/YrhL